MNRRSSWLLSATMMAAMCGVANAAPAADAAMEARLKALEQRVSELEKQLAAQKAAPPPPPIAAPPPAVVAAPPPAPKAMPELWRDHNAWGNIRIGMAWSQINRLLGSPGSKSTGMFGDVWFYPDQSGGRVVFDRDGRVSDWAPPPNQ